MDATSTFADLTRPDYLARWVVLVPIIVLAVLGLIMAAASRTRAAGVTLLVLLGLVVAGGFVLLLKQDSAPMREPEAAERFELESAERFEPDFIVLDDGPERPRSTEKVPPLELDGDDANITVGPGERLIQGSGGETSETSTSSTVSGARPERPSWVGNPAYIENEQSTEDARIDCVPVESGRYETWPECRRALNEALVQAVDEYVEDYSGNEVSAARLGFDQKYIQAHLQDSGVYGEILASSVGPMRQQHALLKFGREFRREVERRWEQVQTMSRLAHVGVIVFAVLAGLGTLFTYLRVDTATKGYYTRRLQFAAATVILGLAVTGVLVARWIPWL